MPSKRVQIGFFSLLVAIILVLAYFIFTPYFSALFLSLVLFIIFEPVFHWAMSISAHKKWLASIITVITIVLVILLPFVLFGFLFFQDARDLYVQVSANGVDQGLVHTWALFINDHVQKILPSANFDVETYINNWLGLLVGNLNNVFSSLIRIILDLIIILLSVFYLFKDGENLKRGVFAFSPLPDTEDQKIFERVKLAINSSVRGSLGVALSQGAMAGIGFAIFGLPSPFLWGAVMAVMALVPTFGTGLVFTPAVIYLFVTGHTAQSIGLAVWGIFAVSLIDNLLGPYLIKRGTHIHPFLILLSVLGGIVFLGPIGFLAGPVVLSLLMLLLPMYSVIVENK